VKAEGESTRSFRRLRVIAGLVSAAALAVTVALPELNGWASSRAKYHADFADPHYDVSIDHDSLHKAGAILRRDGGTYYVYVPRHQPVLLGNLRGAIRLWAVPALQVSYPEDHPKWILSYRTRRLLPSGFRAKRIYSVGPGIALVEVVS
jgi:hypothetical protein